jgi:TolB-like protein/Tfp pilus assembly protein PilF
MFTDMVGYTALMQSNERRAMEVLESHNRLVRPLFAEYHGKEVKAIGDSFLVEFENALDAVECAVAIQRHLHDYNTSSKDDWKVRIRVGIHLGDVIHRDGDTFGDAVNIASRIQPLADPEGVCLSEQVYDQVRNKVGFRLLSLGEKSLKNVSLPIEVYAVDMPWAAGGPPSGEHARTRIAVLPFDNFSPDPADGFFADGMTEELIDRLSQVRQLKVIARTSVMGYKKKEKKAVEIGRELGVGSLVEGSIRKAGNRIRVTAQLIDAGTEEHLWSSRYDKDLDDIFGVQTDIASRITQELAGALAAGNAPKPATRETDNVAAYSYFLQAMQLANENTRESLPKALELIDRSIELDGRFARAYVERGWTMAGLLNKGMVSRPEAISQMKSALQKAMSLDPELPHWHALRAGVAWFEDEHSVAEAEAARAVELNPSDTDSYLMLALVEATLGRPAEAVRLFETAHVLDPLAIWPITNLGLMYVYLGQREKAGELWARSAAVAPHAVRRGMAEGYLIDKDLEKAEDAVSGLEKDFPDDLSTASLRGRLEAIKGDREAAFSAIERLRQRHAESALLADEIASIKYLLGDVDGYFEGMYEVAESHYLNPLTFRYSPLYSGMRKDPRYREVLIRSGLPDPGV